MKTAESMHTLTMSTREKMHPARRWTLLEKYFSQGSMLYQSIERFDAHSQFSNIQGQTVSNQSTLFKRPGFSPCGTGSFQTSDVALGHGKQAIRMNRQYRCRKG